MKKKLVVLSGAGISAESGISTFRDAGGLWEGHDVMEVASPGGWHKNRALVLDFYNQRREQLNNVVPNKAHFALAELEKEFEVQIITQNVDDLHERAGSTNVLHLHGELKKARSIGDASLVYDWEKDIQLGDLCEKGFQLRPHIVWFGEAVPMLDKAIEISRQADIFLVIGTSLVVYPAASLVEYVERGTPIFVIDPNKPSMVKLKNCTFIEKKASDGMEELIKVLFQK
ncbi:MAG: NAD-dependent deacylase [Bacteroidetes bacterium]|nr:NAD-dependent deacylase [Bacteroidota bacterium]